LHGQKQAAAASLRNIHLQEIFSVERHTAADDLIFWMAHQRGSQRAFSGSIGTHDGVHFAALYLKGDSLEYFFIFNLDPKVTN